MGAGGPPAPVADMGGAFAPVEVRPSGTVPDSIPAQFVSDGGAPMGAVVATVDIRSLGSGPTEWGPILDSVSDFSLEEGSNVLDFPPWPLELHHSFLLAEVRLPAVQKEAAELCISGCMLCTYSTLCAIPPSDANSATKTFVVSSMPQISPALWH